MTRTVILSVTDTRSREPLSGRVIPGSGDPVACACCGRDVVIHARVVDVEIVTGMSTWTVVGASRIIGQACAKRHCAIPRHMAKRLVRLDADGAVIHHATI